jgi:hypothetical protein
MTRVGPRATVGRETPDASDKKAILNDE